MNPMLSQYRPPVTKAEHIRAQQREWREQHRTVRITVESHDKLVRWAGKLQAETGEVTGISEALIELLRRVEDNDDGK